MSEDKIQDTKEALYEFTKQRTYSDIELTILRNGANAINQLQQENQQLKEQLQQEKRSQVSIDKIDMKEKCWESLRADYFRKRNKELEIQLYQSNEVIKEINSITKYLKITENIWKKNCYRPIKNTSKDEVYKGMFRIQYILNKYKKEESE